MDGEVFEAIEGAGRARGLAAIISWCSSSSPHEATIQPGLYLFEARACYAAEVS